MTQTNIRCPKGPAIIYLYNCLAYISTILSATLLVHITGGARETEPLAIVRILLWSATNLFMSIVLFSKKYNNLLIISTCVLSIPSVVGLFFGISPYLIFEILFYLLLIAFTYIMVKMPDTPIREKAVKFRFVVPAFVFVLILISTIQTIQSLYENFTETMGTQLSDSMSLAMVLLPSILSAVMGFLPVLCYAWLANWLANPLKKQI